MRWSWLTLCLVLLTSVFGAPLFAYDLTVAKDGTGDHTTVQAAINAAPTGRTTPFTIYIKNGRYKEKINVPSSKPFLQIIGESVANTILTYDDGASTPLPGGGTIGTQNSASFTVNATDFSALNITFENSFGDGSQAVAVLLNADRAAFYNCRFLGNQDTLYTKGSGTPRHYFRSCYIDGNVDFIFGSSVALFENCVVYAKTRTSAGSSYITAANTPAGQTYGYVFRNTRLPANTGGTQYVLGRPWQNSTGSSPLAANKTVFLKSQMGAGLIAPAGWSTWDAGTNTSLITYAEFQSRTFSGNLLNVSQRVAWSQQLTPADTAAYTRANVLGNWDPCAVSAGFCGNAAAEIAVSNFRATKGATQSTLNWNISWAINQVKYELFRSTDNTTFSKLSELTAQNDSTYNFQLTDALPPAGSIYYYYLRASKAGYATHTTETVQVSSAPTITTTGTLGAFAQYQTGTSGVQTYNVSAVNLTADLTITPPANYEISINGGTTWSSAPIVLTPSSNTVAATTVSVRLNAATAGTYAGNITHTSAGAPVANVAVTGTKVNTQAAVSEVLQWWPMTVNNQDSVAVRSSAVTASTSVLRNLYVSNGTTVPAIRAYSAKFGQAFGTTANGDGSWGTAVGGPGGNLSRKFYEQFTVTAAAGRSLRLDSLLLTSAFYNTASNTKLAVVYSLSGFVADSADVTGGRGPAGGLLSTANGGFTTPILLANQTGGPTNTYRLALAGATGVTLAAGQTVTIRLYFSCGSSSTGRYAMLRNVVAKGEDLTPAACNAAFAYSGNAYCVSGTNPTPTITGTTGGTFASTTGLSLNATTGAINLSASTPGSYTVTYNASATCSSTATVTITAPATAGFSYGTPASYCTSAPATTPATLGAGATAGTFSSTTGLTLNATTGAITPSTSTPGTYTVTNTVAASSGCAAVTATATVTILATPARPTVSVQYTTPGTAILTSSAATGNQWLLNGAPIADATGPTYTAPGGTQPGAYTVVVTNASGCTSQASLPLTVTATAKPLAGTSLQVFPNPTRDGKVTVELSGYRKAAQLTVLNTVGQVVLRQSIAAGQVAAAVDLSAQPAGMYLLRLTTEGGTDTRRIVRE
ncbi:hypothetical protein GCM10023186_00650 [Hymenobacter koreensis]|uniref:T9SS type A sorting domain-containing protein n=1 Tax=Hymenobacter koreensis TaxID=1084523 RepID=A0ABP8IUE2_9BACT